MAGSGAAAADAALAAYGAGTASQGVGAGLLAAEGGAAAAPGAMTFVTPGVTEGGMLAGGGATGGSGMTAGQAASFDALGAELSSPSVYQYATANVGAAAPGTGVPITQGGAAAGAEAGAGSAGGALGESQATQGMMASTDKITAANQGSTAMGYLKDAGKAANTYGQVNRAMNAGQPQRRAPAARPVFQGQAAPIAQGGPAAPNQNAVLAAIARRRARGF